MLAASLVWGLLVFRSSKIIRRGVLIATYIAFVTVFMLPDPVPEIRYTLDLLAVPSGVEKSYELLMQHRKGNRLHPLEPLLSDTLWEKCDSWNLFSSEEKIQIEDAWTKAGEARTFIDDLDAFPGITDWTTNMPFQTEIPVLDFQYFRSIARLYSIHAQSLAQSGRTLEALQDLKTLYSVTRKGMPYLNITLDRMIFSMMTKLTLKTTYNIVQNTSCSEMELRFIQQHFLPLGREETSMRRLALSETFFFEGMIWEIKKEVIATQEKKGAYHDLIRIHENLFITETQKNCTLMIKQIDKDPNGVLRDLTFPFIDESEIALFILYPRDVIGQIIFNIGVLSYQKASRTILETKVFSDILSLTVSKRLNDPKILKDPWNQKPYLFDAQQNRFFSVGLDLHPYTVDDIFLTTDLH
jgi:hypothetical protein